MGKGLGDMWGPPFSATYDPAVKPTSPVFRSGHSLATGMVCAYLLNEGSGTSLADSTSQLAAATLANGSWVTDTPGACVVFSGANTKITLPNISALFGSNEASLLLVLKTNSDTPIDTQHSGICNLSTAAFDSHYPYDGDDLIYLTPFRSARFNSINDGAFDKTAWHKFGISAKNGASNYRVFQNGAVLASTAGEASVPMHIAPTIGKSFGDTWLDGRMASVMLWSRALADLEMAALNTDPWVMFR